MTELLTINSAAARLSVSPLTLRKWIFQQRVPVVHVFRSVRIREQDLQALIDFGYQPARRGANK